jgi:heme-degrading monooxygenase HmoA
VGEVDEAILRSDEHTMISRHWKGLCKREDADRYVEHLKRETFPQLATLPGFVRATILRRELADGTEFQVITVWQSLAAIEAFTGRSVALAVVPAAVQAMMVSYDQSVAHYEVAHTFPAQRGGA